VSRGAAAAASVLRLPMAKSSSQNASESLEARVLHTARRRRRPTRRDLGGAAESRETNISGVISKRCEPRGLGAWSEMR